MSHRLKYILGAICWWWLVKVDAPLRPFTVRWAGYYAHGSWKGGDHASSQKGGA